MSSIAQMADPLSLQVFDMSHIRLEIFSHLPKHDLTTCARLRSNECLVEVASHLYRTFERLTGLTRRTGAMKGEALASHKQRLQIYDRSLRHLTFSSHELPYINHRLWTTYPSLEDISIGQAPGYTFNVRITRKDFGQPESGFRVFHGYIRTSNDYHSLAFMANPSPAFREYLDKTFPGSELHIERLTITHLEGLAWAAEQKAEEWKYVRRLMITPDLGDTESHQTAMSTLLEKMPNLQIIQIPQYVSDDVRIALLRSLPLGVTELTVGRAEKVDLDSGEDEEEIMEDEDNRPAPLGLVEALRILHEAGRGTKLQMMDRHGDLSPVAAGEEPIPLFGSREAFPDLKVIKLVALKRGFEVPANVDLINLVVENFSSEVLMTFDIWWIENKFFASQIAADNTREHIEVDEQDEEMDEDAKAETRQELVEREARVEEDLASKREWEARVVEFHEGLKSARDDKTHVDEEPVRVGWAMLPKDN